MKILGIVNSRTYLAEVTHDELEKLTGKYYGKLQDLKVGDHLNLGAGHDFRNDIKSACDGMVGAMTNFKRSQETLRRFAEMVSILDFPVEDEQAEEKQQ